MQRTLYIILVNLLVENTKNVQLIDTVNKDYKIKYLMIASDPMYENEK